MYRAKDFQKLVEDDFQMETSNVDFLIRVLDCIKVNNNGTLQVLFMDDTKVECTNENQ